ncbi:RNA polymerase sigma factor SigF [Nocardia farcinica]|uniref:RNA polymerase sigma factor SigF n=1 Tax=Nocardia farcinica TaxID=37329 RepID=UPI001894AD35|nr:RNA polymerase sigma factor SigF [Nocardia farcinica]MBF6263988.1 RNA polymerase sigma factor SigF [Nocardia farcinica]MBF6283142.1 RNA polymerase sigma factor SigF [Nocardia farcinica]MBF6306854.1 RNA polymerase sigma factor SigF [Nocardia farcinica]MBF6391279.1 RNA polymerase sigma factor SigF [Nocardia farcinica]MBF6490083.1 RNA polymerase sigma factor SigF [Nocardia farcinica]
MREEVTGGSTRAAAGGYQDLEPHFVELRALAEDDPRRRALREELIERCLLLAEHIARKFSGRGENFEDLLQIARVGMVAAVDRFDPTQGAPFLGFAVPTIMGEVRRHFRDHTWSVRVPRRLKELQATLNPAIETLTQRLGRMPKARELAEELGVDIAEVTQALVARNAYQTSSIDGSSGDDGESSAPALADTLGAEDPEFGTVENYLAVKPLIAALPEREQRVLVMRFFHSMSQEQIAQQIGCSQMQVSRILSRTLKSLREQALRD